MELLGEGADILDVGGESTRPGSVRVPQDQELARVLPVIEQLAGHGAIVSVDTTRAAVAERAVAAGARIVNDVSGGLADPEMGGAVAETGAAYVAMHWRGHADVMDELQGTTTSWPTSATSSRPAWPPCTTTACGPSR